MLSGGGALEQLALGDQLGAWYMPLALGLASAAWPWSGEPVRFLAVLVVATPCPRLIAIPVAIIGSTARAARRSIIIRDPAVLERIDCCRTIILDRTGTLTYGEPTLMDRSVWPDMNDVRVLQHAASLEQYSTHPLAKPILQAAARERLVLLDTAELSERPGEGLRGVVDAATYRFHDAPREDSQLFIGHLGARAPAIFIGNGISEAPALVEATVGLAFGHQSEITAEAAGTVVMDTSLRRVDELCHIARRMRPIALQGAVRGMVLNIFGMLVAVAALLPPVFGAIVQEITDLGAVLNGLRAAVPGGNSPTLLARPLAA